MSSVGCRNISRVPVSVSFVYVHVSMSSVGGISAAVCILRTVSCVAFEGESQHPPLERRTHTRKRHTHGLQKLRPPTRGWLLQRRRRRRRCSWRSQDSRQTKHQSSHA